MRARGVPVAVVAALMAWALTTAVAAEPGAIRKVVVGLPFEEAELVLVAEAQRQNLNLVHVMDIRRGMENRGATFRKYKIYQFCNLELGSQIYDDSPDYGAFQFCSVLIYEVDPARTALVASRQGWTLRALPDHQPGGRARAAAQAFERIVDEIFQAVVDEAQARAR